MFILALLYALAVCAVRALFPRYYSDEIAAAAEEFGLDCREVYAVVWTESKFDANAVSPAGAKGLMQLMPGTAEFCARTLQIAYDDETVFRPQDNVRMGCFYLQYLRERFDGDYVYAAYNAGENRVRQWLETGGGIAFKETAEYVKRIRFAKRMYAMLYNFN